MLYVIFDSQQNCLQDQGRICEQKKNCLCLLGESKRNVTFGKANNQAQGVKKVLLNCGKNVYLP